MDNDNNYEIIDLNKEFAFEDKESNEL